ncbi:MAG: phosphatase [Cyanobacteria bacterium SW_9_44_58]|nr:MAG: phosphatase [Cyanobacteria bacterium SW_9_44_58]
MTVSRRKFFFLTGATAVGTVIGSSAFKKLHAKTLMSQAGPIEGFGPLQPDPNGIFDLPRGFQYRAFSRTGETMTDGSVVPTAHDGMAAFDGGAGRTILVRNHELSATDEEEVAKSFQANPNIPVYDPGAPGGTATLLVDSDNRLVEQRRSLAGTENNCAGGPIKVNSRFSNGSWLSGEETIILPASDNPLTKPHGYVFEVPAEINKASDAVPIRDMGRFLKEAVAEDPETGFIYETNDDFFELGLFYRFRPNQVGDLTQGGTLEALVIDGMEGVDTSNNNQDTIQVGQTMPVRWVQIPVPDPQANNQNQGNNNQRKIQHQQRSDGRKVREVAALFNRTEGCWYDGNGGIVICATDAGPNELGQIWFLDVRNQTLELIAEPRNPDMLQSPDNITVMPDGQTFLACEDGDGTDRLVGITKEGQTFVVGRNALNNAEIAGATFSANGQTLFLNAPQDTPGVTLAITGPWDQMQQ